MRHCVVHYKASYGSPGYTRTAAPIMPLPFFYPYQFSYRSIDVIKRGSLPINQARIASSSISFLSHKKSPYSLHLDHLSLYNMNNCCFRLKINFNIYARRSVKFFSRDTDYPLKHGYAPLRIIRININSLRIKLVCDR